MSSSLMNVLPTSPRGSLKSSSSIAQNGFDAKPVERALHEAAQRFVEVMPDSRITFFSTPEHLERRVRKEKGYFLNGHGRVGYLLCMEKKPILWMDEQKKQCIRIGARIAKSISDEESIFIATLDKFDNFLRIDDCWMYKGKSLTTLPFTQRWDYVLKFYSFDYKHDSFLERGLRIEPATYHPISDFHSVATQKEWIHWMPEDSSQKRIRVQLQNPPQQTQTQAHQKPQVAPPSSMKQKQEKHKSPSSLTAKAVPHPTFPDTYTLFTAENTEKGIAAVQKYQLSKKLKEAFEKEKKGGGQHIYVLIEWNSDFEKWQIYDLAPEDELFASPSVKWVVEN